MNSQVLTKINRFTQNRFIELGGAILVLSGVFLFVSILSYSPADPNFIHETDNNEIKNLGGFYGSIISDFLLQAIGLITFLFTINLLYWGFKIITEKKILRFSFKIFCTMIYIIFGTALINIFYNDSFWLIDNGNGGFVGRIIKENIYFFLGPIENKYIYFTFLLISITFFIFGVSFL